MRQALIGGAIALVAWWGCGSAGATIADGKAGGNSELFLSVVDEAAKVSYFRDLGVTFDGFLSHPSQPLNFAADPNWANFLAAGVDANGLIYNVAGISIPDGADPRYLSTAQVGVDLTDPSNAPFTGPLLFGFPSVNGYVLDNASLPNNSKNHSTHASQANGSDIATPGDLPFAYFGDGFGRDWQGNATQFDSTESIGKPLAFWLLTPGATGLGPANATLQRGTWLLSQDGTLAYSVSSVPEPQSWILLVCGLLGVGAFTRRRMS